MTPSCIVCSVFVAFVRIYAFTIKTCLPPADRHTAACASWRPHPNPPVSLSSHPSLNSSVPSSMAVCHHYIWHRVSRQCDNYNQKQHKYVCITTYQPDTKSNPNPNPNPNPTTKQHTIVNIRLNVGTCPTYADKFVWTWWFTVLLSIAIVTLPQARKPLWQTVRRTNWHQTFLGELDVGSSGQLPLNGWPMHNPSTWLWPSSTTVVSAESFKYWAIVGACRKRWQSLNDS